MKNINKFYGRGRNKNKFPAEYLIKIADINLPSEIGKRYEVLYSYFQDSKILECAYENDYWAVRIARHAFDYCDNLQHGLEWLSITKKEVPMFFLEGSNYFFSLLDAWIPYGWSKFLAANIGNYPRLILLHLDDHKDLMPTKISSTYDNWSDLITNKPVNFEDPDTIYDAIHSGSISIGSIVTPLLHFIKDLKIFHLKSQVKNKMEAVNPVYSYDKIFDKKIKILNSDSRNTGSINYYLSSCPFDLISMCDSNTPILLHIDMDYFNNRYNGNSDWGAESKSWDPDIIKQRIAIDNFVRALYEKRLQNQIVHVAIGVSPSFYPSEYWDSGVGYLINKLCELGLDLAHLKKTLNI